ncbi:LytTR family DNA-binding domain-containing protein [Pedobacter jeongneungensis]|uniref:LytTR family DNA-binding domain-containing protein n=1 Tax=Pedobacter jeongneungensis TaxID=947309 RepID=A0ABP8B9A1_9SPHI
MYKCIIVDDELHSIEGLTGYIDKIPELNLIQTFTDPTKALLEIREMPVLDLILLDIDMPGMSGLELAVEIRKNTKKLVFTTAHSKYGYNAFEADADTFLLKPYSVGKFISTFQKLFPSRSRTSELQIEEDFVFVKSKDDHRLIRVNVSEIIAVESKLNYIQLHTTSASIMTYMSLTEFSQKIRPRKGLLQFQRSFIIAQEYIEYIDGNMIKMVNGIKIFIGDHYRKSFDEFINTNLIKPKRRNQ